MKVGFLSVDYTKAARSLGGSAGSNSTTDALFRQLVAGINATGGLGGRKVVASYYVIDGTASDYEAAANSACAYFAQDQKVAFVGFYGFVLQGFSNCLRKAGIAEFNGDQFSLERKALEALPSVFFPDALSLDLEAATTIDQAVRTGWLTTKDKVGVIVAGCDYSQRVYSSVIAPRMKRNGISVEFVTPYSCPAGFDSVSGIASGIQNAVLRFQTDGITRVMYETPVQNLVNAGFAIDAESQNYRPGYLLSSNALLQSNQGSIPAKQLEKMKGAGWDPVADLFGHGLPKTSARSTCNSLAHSAGVTPPADPTGQTQFYAACDIVTLMRKAMQQSHGTADMSSLTQAVRSTSSGYLSASSFGPVDPRSVDSVAVSAPYSYKPACQCVSYDGGPSAVRL